MHLQLAGGGVDGEVDIRHRLVADLELDDATLDGAAHACPQPLAHRLDDVFGVRDPQSRQETALEQSSLVVIADDRKVAVGVADESKIVAAGADVLAADDEPSGFRSAVAAVA